MISGEDLDFNGGLFRTSLSEEEPKALMAFYGEPDEDPAPIVQLSRLSIHSAEDADGTRVGMGND